MQHIKLENRGNTQEKTHCSTANINVQAALRMHPTRRKINGQEGRAHRSCTSVFRLENFHLKFKNSQVFVCLSFFRNFASLEQ